MSIRNESTITFRSASFQSDSSLQIAFEKASLSGDHLTLTNFYFISGSLTNKSPAEKPFKESLRVQVEDIEQMVGSVKEFIKVFRLLCPSELLVNKTVYKGDKERFVRVKFKTVVEKLKRLLENDEDSTSYLNMFLIRDSRYRVPEKSSVNEKYKETKSVEVEDPLEAVMEEIKNGS